MQSLWLCTLCIACTLVLPDMDCVTPPAISDDALTLLLDMHQLANMLGTPEVAYAMLRWPEQCSGVQAETVQ